MPDLWVDVDVAVTVPVNIMSLLDDTDFKTRETAVAYNAAGMDLVWNFITCAGVITQTAVTPTDGTGVYDWTHVGDGMYKIEIPASGGVSINNDTEGFGWFTGLVTGVLPWRGPIIGFRRAAMNDLLIEGSTASTNLEDFFDGTGYAGGTARLKADVDTIKTQAVTCAAGVTVLASVGTAATSTAQTGDSFARLGAPAGASVSADVAAVKVDTAATLDDTGTAGVVVAAASKTGYELSATGSAALTEGYPADGATGTLPQLLYLLLAVLAEFAISGTTITCKKLDGLTTAATYTLDDGTNPTSRTRAT